MQEGLFIKQTRVVMWRQKSLSDFLGTLLVEMKSRSQTIQPSVKNCFFIQLQHLITFVIDFQGKLNIQNPNKEKGNACWVLIPNISQEFPALNLV